MTKLDYFISVFGSVIMTCASALLIASWFAPVPPTPPETPRMVHIDMEESQWSNLMSRVPVQTYEGCYELLTPDQRKKFEAADDAKAGVLVADGASWYTTKK